MTTERGRWRRVGVVQLRTRAEEKCEICGLKSLSAMASLRNPTEDMVQHLCSSCWVVLWSIVRAMRDRLNEGKLRGGVGV